MRRLVIALAAALLVPCTLSAQTLGAVLTGSQETPATTTSGFGNATITFDSTRQNINVTITVANLGSPITAAHIHGAAAGAAGSVVLAFTPAASFTNNKLTGTFPITSDLASQILANPSNFYVNVHTSQFPGGAVRGQLALISGTVVNLAADLRGSNEVPATGSNAFGSVFLSFDSTNRTITWELNTSGITGPSAAHIHTGAAGASGGVLIGFVTSASSFTSGRAKGQITGVDATTMSNILANPSGFYFNVHSPAFPGGEVRGQLASANEADIAVAGHVTNGIGQTFVSDARVFNPSYDTAAAALVEVFQAGTSANTNATNSIVVNIPPRGTAILNDVAGSSGLNLTGTGALRVTSAEPVVTTSRIYTTTNGTFGQFVPATSSLRRGVMPQLSNSSGSTGFRTNIGFFNPNAEPVTVRLELRDATGALVGQNTLTLAALSQQQNSIAAYFSGVDLSSAQNLTLSFDAGAPVLGYGSVVDNISADQIFVPAQADTGVATTSL